MQPESKHGGCRTSHLVYGDDDVAQRKHQRSVLHRISLLQAQLLPLGFATVLGRPPEDARPTGQVPVWCCGTLK